MIEDEGGGRRESCISDTSVIGPTQVNGDQLNDSVLSDVILPTQQASTRACPFIKVCRMVSFKIIHYLPKKLICSYIQMNQYAHLVTCDRQTQVEVGKCFLTVKNLITHSLLYIEDEPRGRKR